MRTALVRIEGRAVGVVANDCMHLSGAIDSDAADKATRFMNLCDARGRAANGNLFSMGARLPPPPELVGHARGPVGAM